MPWLFGQTDVETTMRSPPIPGPGPPGAHSPGDGPGKEPSADPQHRRSEIARPAGSFAFSDGWFIDSKAEAVSQSQKQKIPHRIRIKSNEGSARQRSHDPSVSGDDDERTFYQLIPTTFGTVGAVWRQAALGPRVRQVALGKARKAAEQAIRQGSLDSRERSSPAIVERGGEIPLLIPCHRADRADGVRRNANSTPSRMRSGAMGRQRFNQGMASPVRVPFTAVLVDSREEGGTSLRAGFLIRQGRRPREKT